MKKIAKKRGFTLAEVLITLDIIGVVAAITIPILEQNIQDKQFKEAAKAAYSKASQAIQLMKIDNGGDLNYYHSTDFSFTTPFTSYFKIAQNCNTLCVPSTGSSSVYTSYSGMQAITWYMSSGQFITTDGMFWGIGDNHTLWGPKISIYVDVNGYIKGPNIYGRDVFLFQVVNDALVPGGANNSDYSTLFSCRKVTTGTNNMDRTQGLGCMQNVMQGIDY